MRIDFDSFSVLTFLWGVLPGAPTCPVSPRAISMAMHEAIPTVERMPVAVTVFVDVNVIPMDSERVLANQTVLVEGERIIGLGPASKVQVPAGTVRIDGRGMYLMPGLANMHEHGGSGAEKEHNNDRMFRFLANGVTTVRHPGYGISVIQQTARPKAPTETPGPYPNMYIPGTRVTNTAAAGQRGSPVAMHSNQGASFGQTLALGSNGSSEHLTEYFDTLGAYFGLGPQGALDVPVSAIRALVAAAQRAGVWASPTLDCLEERRSLKQVKVARQIVKALQDAGAGLLLGADADLGARQSPSMVHSELAALIRAGLTPYQALLTGTRNPAQYLGRLDSSGTIAVGKRADLVLLHGNPLADIRHTREPAGVMIGGQWLDRTTLDQRLLAPPTGLGRRSWLVLEVMGGTSPALTSEQSEKLGVHYEKFGALTDSLIAAKSLQVVQQLALELEAMRAILTPEQRVTFDPKVRVWLREQVRQGHKVTVPGVTPVS